MRIFKISKWVVAAATGVLMASCLDFDPKQQLADGNYWETPSDFKLFANNYYGWLRSFTAATEYQSTKPAHSDFFADLLINKGEFNLFSNGTNVVPAADGNYGSNYSHIRRCNMLLEHAADYPSQADIATYMGEAYFFRAYCYFDLLQLYGDAIIVTKTLEVGDPLMYAERNDRSDVADLIIDDLRKAIDLLPKAQMVEEDGRISKEAAQAFLGRVALYEGTWQKFRGNTTRANDLLTISLNASKAVMETGTYTLFRPAALGVQASKYLFILENAQCNGAALTKSANHEYIISRRYDEVLAPLNFNVTHTYINNAVWVTKKFADMYLCQNGLPIEYNGTANPKFGGRAKMDSEWADRDNRMRYTLMQPHDKFWTNSKPRKLWTDADKDPFIADFVPNSGTGYFTQKWAVEREVSNGKESFDFPVLRYAEVLLNYAEAKFELNDAIDDADLDISLNQVRLRVNPDMPRLSNNLVNNNGLDMRTEIRRERTIELFNEGFRLDDLKRWKTAETEMPQDLLGITWKGTEFETKWSNCPRDRNADGAIILEKGRKFTEKNYLFPLPTDQLQLNKNLKQNPKW